MAWLGPTEAIQKQGDQIGRIFAQWAIVYFGQFLSNFRYSPIFMGSVFQSIDYVLILTATGENPTITSCNASVVNFYNATGSLARFENKKYFILLWKTL
jgi:hypothetical protein